MAEFSRIVCLFDLLRSTRSDVDVFFDLVREPMRQGCGVDIGFAPGGKKLSNLLPNFDLREFRALAGWTPSNSVSLWADHHYCIESTALDYLLSHVPEGSLVLSYDVPPWLRRACDVKKIPVLDARRAPLRFGRDLYIALDTSDAVVGSRIAAQAVSAEELRLEAALLSANVRAHRTRLDEAWRYVFDLDGALIFVGQHPKDVALLTRAGRLSSVDFVVQLRGLAQGRRLFYLPDYQETADFIQQEIDALAEALGGTVRLCMQSTYQILSAHDDVLLTGISSPVLQEAGWFGAHALGLAQPLTPLRLGQEEEERERNAYWMIRFQDMISPDFWHAVLSPQASAPKLARLPTVSRHHGRELLDDWGEYEKVLTWERALPYHGFERSGGLVLRKRVEALEEAFKTVDNEPSVAADSKEPGQATAIKRLKDTKVGQTAYILGNAPSLEELYIEKLMERESFWCNKAYKIKDQGYEFRPKYYFLSDFLLFQVFPDEAVGVRADVKFLRREIYNLAKKSYPKELSDQNIVVFDAKEVPGLCMCDDDGNFSYDPAESVYCGWTVVLYAIQFAFYMGYSKVYVGGVDLDYQVGQTHFFKEPGFRETSDVDVLTSRMRDSFVVARKHFEKNGRVLAKLTRSPNLPLEFVGDTSLRRN